MQFVALTSGDLDQRVQLQRRVSTQDETGQVVYTWANVAGGNVWAQAEPLAGRELLAAQQTQSEITTRFRIRYRPDIDPTMRVLWLGVPYDIASPPIDVNGRRAKLELMCKHGLKDGAP